MSPRNLKASRFWSVFQGRAGFRAFDSVGFRKRLVGFSFHGLGFRLQGFGRLG